MISGSFNKYEVGEIENKIWVNDIKYNQPIVILRIATEEEYLQYLKETAKDELDYKLWMGRFNKAKASGKPIYYYEIQSD